MQLPAPSRRSIEVAAILFGTMLALVLLWTTQLAPLTSLQGVPINSGSYGLSTSALAGITALNLIGITLGAFLVARLWEPPWRGVLCGGIAAALVQVGTAYLITLASLQNNPDAELILFRLPLGLLFGGFVWFAGGLLGAAAERLALGKMLEFVPQRAILGIGLLAILGATFGLIAGGSNQRREDIIAAARAVNVAFIQSTGRGSTPSTIPTNYFISGPATETLTSLRDQATKPYQLLFDSYDGREVVTLIQINDGPTVRCVSTGAVISRCFRTG
jgi:hypothetical protein